MEENFYKEKFHGWLQFEFNVENPFVLGSVTEHLKEKVPEHLKIAFPLVERGNVGLQKRNRSMKELRVNISEYLKNIREDANKGQPGYSKN